LHAFVFIPGIDGFVTAVAQQVAQKNPHIQFVINDKDFFTFNIWWQFQSPEIPILSRQEKPASTTIANDVDCCQSTEHAKTINVKIYIIFRELGEQSKGFLCGEQK